MAMHYSHFPKPFVSMKRRKTGLCINPSSNELHHKAIAESLLGVGFVESVVLFEFYPSLLTTYVLLYPMIETLSRFRKAG
jgi:hypothetical protein